MKTEYPRYGHATRAIAEQLSESDQNIIERFLSFCGRQAGDKHLTKLRTHLLQFADIVEKPLDQITSDDAIAYWGLVHRAPYEEHTKVAMQKCVKRFLKWFYRDLEMLEPLRIKRHVVNHKKVNKAALLTKEELKRLLHAAEKIRDKTLIVVFHESGARPEEVQQLQWKHVNWQDREVHFYSNKTSKDRDLPLRESFKHLQRWHDEWVLPDPKADDFMFPSSNGTHVDRTKPISIAYIWRTLRRIAEKAGLKKNVWTYLFRHSRLTEVHKAGVQGPEFKKFAGHVPGSVQEEVYVHLDNEDMKQSVLEKVYKISDEESSEKQYEERIAVIEDENRLLKERLGAMEQSLRVIDELSRQLKGRAVSLSQKM